MYFSTINFEVTATTKRGNALYPAEVVHAPRPGKRCRTVRKRRLPRGE